MAIGPDATRQLWYDELLSFYGATASSYSRFVQAITHFDFNPPLQYLLIRLSISLLGPSELATRLPSISAFIAASFLLFRFIRGRAGDGYAWIAMGLLWSSGFFAYATQARPYALELLFCTVAFISWTRAVREQLWTRSHNLLLMASAGLFLSHSFAPIFLLPLCAGQLASTGLRLRKGWRMWIALLGTTPLALLYLPFMLKPNHVLYPSGAITLQAMGTFYGRLVLNLFLPVLLGVSVLLIVRRRQVVRRLMGRHEIVCLMAGVAAPSVLIVYCWLAGIPYADRYGISIAIPVALLSVHALHARVPQSGTAPFVSALFVLGGFCLTHGAFVQHAAPLPLSKDFPQTELLVVANGAHFLELDHYEDSAVKDRLYYLTDHQAAIRYSHATIFDEFARLPTAYPIQGRVRAYSNFIQRHAQFWVVSLPTVSHQDWLLCKLRADGARLIVQKNQPWLYQVAFGSRDKAIVSTAATGTGRGGNSDRE